MSNQTLKLTENQKSILDKRKAESAWQEKWGIKNTDVRREIKVIEEIVSKRLEKK